jgi:hypothetical protein
MSGGSWCLVLALWGDVYSDQYVNVIVRSVLNHSPGCSGIVLFTDRIRPAVDDRVEQKLFPAFFNRAEFFRPGFIVKLSVFDRQSLPPDTRCVYLDLDTVVCGDLGRVAALVQGPDDWFMLPPGGAAGFGLVRHLIFRLTKGRHLAIGNSSIMAYHSGAEPNLCEAFQRLFEAGDGDAERLKVDDLFISWFAQARLRGIPSSLCVMFRREFLSRSAFVLWCRSVLPFVRRRREGIVAITLNGENHKPALFLACADGARINGSRGRFGYWSHACLGTAKARIEEFCRSVEAAESGTLPATQEP